MMMTINNTTKNGSHTIWPFLVLKNKKLLLTVFYLFFILVGCQTNKNYTIETFKLTSGWGYKIHLNNKLIIKQTIIPVVNKQKSFETEEDALKTATLVQHKLSDNLPPTITKEDLIILAIKI